MERLLQNKVFLTFAGALCLFGLYTLLVPQKFGSQMPTQTARYTLFATSTLTAAYTSGGAVSSTGRLSKALPNVVIAGTYKPTSHGSQLNILVERSIDDGLTYQPYNILEVQSDEVLVHTSGTGGIPFVIPGSGTSASGTVIGFDFDLTMSADFIRVSAKENTTSTFGTVQGKLYLQSP